VELAIKALELSPAAIETNPELAEELLNKRMKYNSLISYYSSYGRVMGEDMKEAITLDVMSLELKVEELNNAVFEAEYSENLEGWVLKFIDGKYAHTQSYIEKNRLHADYGRKFQERDYEYDDELSESQEDVVDDFVVKYNRLLNISEDE